MMTFKNKDLDILDKKRLYLIDKINAHFKEAQDYKNNPVKTEAKLFKEFNKKLEEGLQVFK